MRFRDLFGGTPIEPSRDARHVTPLGQSSRVINYTITVNVGGFGSVGFKWEGTSEENARESFFEYLYNSEFDLPGRPGWRSHPVIFYGKSQSLVFKTDWLTGFTIARA